MPNTDNLKIGTLIVSSSPHLYSKESIPKIIWWVFFCLIPAGIAGIIFFGIYVLKIIIVSITTAVLTEAIIQRLIRRKVAILDGSAALTGLLLAYNLPPRVPLWIAAVGSFFAIAIVKQAFGGLGRNIFNPALAARAFLLASWPKYMTSFIEPFQGIDAITSATPLAVFKHIKFIDLKYLGISYFDLFIGKRGGCIGEVCIVALLIGAIILLLKKYISWHIPLSFIATVGLLSWIFGSEGYLSGDWLFAILSGGLILGAFFMATDYVTSPITRKAKIIFGICCGLITFLIRRFGGYPEGVSYSILLMNAFVPLLDRLVRPRIYGIRLK